MSSTHTATEPTIIQPEPAAPNGRRRTFLRLLMAVLLAIAAIFVWDQFIKYRIIAKRWGEVVPGQVYRSGQVSRWVLPKKLREHDIQVVIDLNGIEPDDEHQAAEIETVKEMGVEHHRFRLRGDGTGDIRNYARAIQVIDRCVKERRPVLVHCAAGAQRTGGVVATYRVLVRGDSPHQAWAEMQRYGWDPDSDLELLPYVNGHMAELAGLLVEMGVIERVPDPLPVIGP